MRGDDVWYNQIMKTIMIVQCHTCKKDLERKPSRLNYNKGGLWFCGRECRAVYQDSQSSRITLDCPICGKQFEVKPYRLNSGKKLTCSYSCGLALLGWGSKILNCDYCGQEFRRKNAEIKKQNFCSRECMGNWQSENIHGENSPSWKGGYLPYYGKDWNRMNKETRKRDNHTCQGCGVTQNQLDYTLEIHHKKPVRLFENPNDANSSDNLITLCRPCHVRSDVFARWLFSQDGSNAQVTHPLQNDSTILRVYLNHPAFAP